MKKLEKQSAENEIRLRRVLADVTCTPVPYGQNYKEQLFDELFHYYLIRPHLKVNATLVYAICGNSRMRQQLSLNLLYELPIALVLHRNDLL